MEKDFDIRCAFASPRPQGEGLGVRAETEAAA